MGCLDPVPVSDQFNISRLIWHLPFRLLKKINFLSSVGFAVHYKLCFFTVGVGHHPDDLSFFSAMIPVWQHMTHRLSGKDCLCHIKGILCVTAGVHHSKIRRNRRPCIRCRFSKIIKTGPHKSSRHKIPRHNVLPGLPDRSAPVCCMLIIAADHMRFLIVLVTASYRKRGCGFTGKHRHIRMLLMEAVVLLCLIINTTYIQRIHSTFLQINASMHRSRHKSCIIQRTDLLPHGMRHTPAFLRSLQRLLVKDRIHNDRWMISVTKHHGPKLLQSFFRGFKIAILINHKHTHFITGVKKLLMRQSMSTSVSIRAHCL